MAFTCRLRPFWGYFIQLPPWDWDLTLSGWSPAKMIWRRSPLTLIPPFYWLSVLRSGLALLLLLGTPLINQLFIKVTWAEPVIRWSALLILLTALERILENYFRARLRFISYSFTQILQVIAYVLGLVLILQAGGGLIEVVWWALFVKLIAILILTIYFYTKGEVRTRLDFVSTTEMRSMIHYGFPIVLSAMSAWLLNLSDRAVLGFYLDVGVVGVYGAAYGLAGLVIALAAPFWNQMYPYMAIHHNQNNKQAMAHTCRRYSSAYFMLGIPAMFGLTILSTTLLTILGDSDFAIPQLLFGFIVFGLFFDQFSTSAHYVIYLRGETIYLRNATVITGVFNLALNFLLIPYFGINAAAVVTMISYLLLDALLFYKMSSLGYRILDFYNLKALALILVSAMVMAVVVLVMLNALAVDNLLTVMLIVGAGFVSYSAMLLLLLGFRPRSIFALLKQ